MLQYGQSLKVLCYIKEASHKRPDMVGLRVYEMSRIGKYIATESRRVVT